MDDDTLDLHTFRPKDVPQLVPDFVDDCAARGYQRIRIIHGKGKGTLRRITHAALERHPAVASYSFDEATGNWGATVVVLKPPVKQTWPAPERNKEPILDVLKGCLPETGTVLEIACGTGQHAVHFARGLPGLTWLPTDPDPESLASAFVRHREEALPNLLEPARFGVEDPHTPVESIDVVVCINMIHIAPWQRCLDLLDMAEQLEANTLFFYGPFFEEQTEPAPSNLDFDRSLKSRDSSWGIRRVEVVREEAAKRGFTLSQRVEMPANNLSLVFRSARK